MGIKLQLPKLTDLRPRITVIGVGGAGGNAVNNMIATGLSGVEFVVANTDAQALAGSPCENRIQLGVNLTEGLGAGSKPEIGEAAAQEAVEEIRSVVSGSHMVFIAAGMGGGTGTGAAGVIARLAKEMDILTVAIVTKPFQFEGSRRMRIADAGIAELKKYVDTLIVIPNQNLFRIANERTTFAEAFVLADQVLYSGIACIVDLIVKEGLINLDFADVRTVLSGMGTAMMGTGEASGDRRAIVAAEEAISNPLLDELTLSGAKGLLVSIIGGRDLTLYEVDEAASRVRQEVDTEANIIVGATFDDSMADRVRVSIVASGMGGRQAAVPPPVQHSAYPAHATAQQPAPANRTEDLSEAFSRALGSTERGVSAGGPSAQNQAGWRAGDGVTIEDGLGPLSANLPPPLPGQSRSQDLPVDQTAFTPQRPQEIRRPQRRVPGIEEFPEVGQREYRAKTTNAAPRRSGLLDMLTGRSWGAGANQKSGHAYPQAGTGKAKPPANHAQPPASVASPEPPSGGRDESGHPIDSTRNFDRRRG